MKNLRDLISGISTFEISVEIAINTLSTDSRQIVAGGLYANFTANDNYLHMACEKGAAVVFMPTNGQEYIQRINQCWILYLNDLPEKFAKVAAKFYDYPSQKMYTFGVTGTNGKTSCVNFIAQALTSQRTPCGIIGTLGSGIFPAITFNGYTTPHILLLQSTLEKLYQQGALAVAMEVSSHSIHQRRIAATHFNVAIYTNLTQDHLDYHKTMQAYAQVKYSYLAHPLVDLVIINQDDAYGAQWLTRLKAIKKVYSYGKFNTNQSPDVSFKDLTITADGMLAKINSPWGTGILKTQLVGEFNLYNLLASYTALCCYGISHSQALASMASIQPVAGRMQRIVCFNKQPLVVVDYAHTPDALRQVLTTLKQYCEGQLICVFGCGGDRDATKRPLMGNVAAQYADAVIITNDNPRHESPEVIAEQIVAGIDINTKIKTIFDRKAAIQHAINASTDNDCVLIAGKGAELYQQFGDTKTPFDDAEVARRCLMEKFKGEKSC